VTVAERIDAEKRLNDQLAAYAGRWVAVRDGEVISDAETLRELLDQVEDQTEAEVVQVADDPHVACFYWHTAG
jgi:hypothetical protein